MSARAGKVVALKVGDIDSTRMTLRIEQGKVRKAGFDPQQAHRMWIRMNRWQSVMRRPVRYVMNLEWFRVRGIVFLHDFPIAFSRTG